MPQRPQPVGPAMCRRRAPSALARSPDSQSRSSIPDSCSTVSQSRMSSMPSIRPSSCGRSRRRNPRGRPGSPSSRRRNRHRRPATSPSPRDGAVAGRDDAVAPGEARHAERGRGHAGRSSLGCFGDAARLLGEGIVLFLPLRRPVGRHHLHGRHLVFRAVGRPVRIVGGDDVGLRRRDGGRWCRRRPARRGP